MWFKQRLGLFVLQQIVKLTRTSQTDLLLILYQMPLLVAQKFNANTTGVKICIVKDVLCECLKSLGRLLLPLLWTQRKKMVELCQCRGVVVISCHQDWRKNSFLVLTKAMIAQVYEKVTFSPQPARLQFYPLVVVFKTYCADTTSRCLIFFSSAPSTIIDSNTFFPLITSYNLTFLLNAPAHPFLLSEWIYIYCELLLRMKKICTHKKITEFMAQLEWSTAVSFGKDEF